MKCYYCHEEGHIRKNCPKLKNRDKEKEKRGNTRNKDSGSACQIRSRRRRKRNYIHGHVGANNLCEEAGIFVQGNLNGSSAKLLIDTGASLTLVSRRFYDKLTRVN